MGSSERETNEDERSLLVSDRREVHPDIGSIGLKSCLEDTDSFWLRMSPLLKSLVESYLT